MKPNRSVLVLGMLPGGFEPLRAGANASLFLLSARAAI
jgi:hypothetical protein